MLAVVRVRGSVNLSPKAKETLKFLKLSRPNHCVLYPKEKSIEGMLNVVHNLVTWGEINNETLEKMIYKRGRMLGDKRVEKKDAKVIAKKISEKKESEIKNVFRLSPPSGGYKPVKLSFPKGASGNRGEKINDLLKRML
jgi:large subunit ribosomal protein L30